MPCCECLGSQLQLYQCSPDSVIMPADFHVAEYLGTESSRELMPHPQGWNDSALYGLSDMGQVSILVVVIRVDAPCLGLRNAVFLTQ